MYVRMGRLQTGQLTLTGRPVRSLRVCIVEEINNVLHSDKIDGHILDLVGSNELFFHSRNKVF